MIILGTELPISIHALIIFLDLPGICNGRFYFEVDRIASADESQQLRHYSNKQVIEINYPAGSSGLSALSNVLILVF
jgi:hypothetical protein